MLKNENMSSSLRPGLLKLYCAYKPPEDLDKMLIPSKILNSYKYPGDVHAAGPETAL